MGTWQPLRAQHLTCALPAWVLRSSPHPVLMCPAHLPHCSIFTYNSALPDGTSTQGGYSTHYVCDEK